MTYGKPEDELLNKSASVEQVVEGKQPAPEAEKKPAKKAEKKPKKADAKPAVSTDKK